MKPLITKGVLRHRNFVSAESALKNLVLACGGDQVIALVGCTRAGKSTIFRRLVQEVAACTAGHAKGTLPLIQLNIETSQEGRISPKYLTLQMLKALGHAKYVHFGEMDEAHHYIPSRGFDESSMRLALHSALNHRQTRFTFVDEAHHLTHTKSVRLRANVLQSIKCLCAVDRTLVMVGGYELAYGGMFDSAHFAGRLHVVDLPPYEDSDEDMTVWCEIVKRMGEHLPLANPKLLVNEAEWLRHAANGSVGLLQKLLFECKVESQTTSGRIDKRMLLAHAPPAKENSAIRRDIELGKEALTRFTVIKPPLHQASTRKGRRPFQQKPTRRPLGLEGA